MADVEIRPASEADLAQVYDVFYDNEVGDDPDPPLRGDVPPWLGHVLATGQLLVAERGGRVVGFAGLIVHGPVAYLTDLFVRREQQSAGVGRTLLRRILPAGGVRCTMSSRDPRALALYVRASMRPQWPNLLRADTARLGALPPADVAVVTAELGDEELLRWDAAVSGRYRPAEHAYWLAQAAIPVWFERRGDKVGYGYIQTRSPSALWSGDAVTVGPVGARTPEDAAACLYAAVEFARTRSWRVRLSVPGPHPALGAVLDARFQITYAETFVSSATAPFVDPTRYAGSGDFF